MAIVNFALEPFKKFKKPIEVQDKTKSENPPNPPPIMATEHRPENYRNPKDAWKDLTKWGKFKRIFKVAEGVALVVGVFAVCFVYAQLKAMKAQTVAMQEQVSTMQLDERAWIDPYQFTVWSDDGFSKSWYMILHFKNIGKTPASHVFASFGITNSFDAIPNLSTDPVTNWGNQVLFPNEESRVSTGIMPISELNDFVKGDGTNAYLYGVIMFNDVYGHHHWVRFSRIDFLKTRSVYPSQKGDETDNN